ncbi:MAG: ABC transporter ATP-binding protein [Bacteriovoracaceae bacterium]
MIEFKSISKTFRTEFWKPGFKALDELNFKLQAGSLTGFLGANGAGKTTSLKILFQFIKADQGEVLFDESLGSDWGEIRSNIGFVPERPYFYPHLTGREFLFFMGGLNNVSKAEIKSCINDWAERLGIEFALDRKVRGYSKGMLQRIGLLSALLNNPKLLILDEPLSGLDPLGRTELKKSFLELNKLGMTIFFSSHIVSDVEEVCEDVIVIDKGKLVYEGSIREALESKQDTSIIIEIRPNNQSFEESILSKAISQTDDLLRLSIKSHEEKENLLKEVIAGEAELLSVNKEKLTLEEFVYHVRG